MKKLIIIPVICIAAVVIYFEFTKEVHVENKRNVPGLHDNHSTNFKILSPAEYSNRLVEMKQSLPVLYSNWLVESKQMFITNQINDGTGRVILANKNKAILSMLEENGRVVWTLDLNAQDKNHYIFSMEISNNKIIAGVGPYNDQYYYDLNTGKLLGISGNHHPVKN